MTLDKTLNTAIFQDILDKSVDKRARSEATHISLLLNRYQTKKHVLNVGCGLGRHDKWLRKLGFSVDSVDINPGFIKIAKKRNPGFQKNYKVGSMLKLPYSASSFDAALCLYSVFNIPNDKENKRVLRELARVLKPKGILIMDMQNKNPKKTTLGTHTSKASNGIIKVTKTKFVGNYLVGKETLYKKNKAGKMNKVAYELSKERLYTPSELRILCQKNGFDVLDFYKAYTLHKLGANDLQLLIVARKR